MERMMRQKISMFEFMSFANGNCLFAGGCKSGFQGRPQRQSPADAGTGGKGTGNADGGRLLQIEDSPESVRFS